ncbi:hypothetical protein M427DRAFT_382485 [Gonapodya prolifera JEL478]|uniref:Uncharacterized protein n=1 Tax=Gonapodya prolifera (strain JEL478) TaxID=1344416 RepID=A0A139A9F4_GONPJ|nr:hypothetical protein M427DRAFT_382485 [Gonapodya prolifera JEL478]|eukprot:KXS13298.1 hypothetical protein M427DRAFT_382485 [Gonapodya prolifera JEL478]
MAESIAAEAADVVGAALPPQPQGGRNHSPASGHFSGPDDGASLKQPRSRRATAGSDGKGLPVDALPGSRLRGTSARSTGVPLWRAATATSSLATSGGGGPAVGGFEVVPVTVDGAVRIAEALRGETARERASMTSVSTGDRRSRRSVVAENVGQGGGKAAVAQVGVLAAELAVEAWMRRVHLAWIARMGARGRERDAWELGALQSRVKSLEQSLAELTTVNSTLQLELDSTRKAHQDVMAAERERLEQAEQQSSDKVRETERLKKRTLLTERARSKLEKDLKDANDKIFKLQTSNILLESSSSALQASEKLVEQMTRQLLMWEDDRKVAKRALQRCDELDAELKVTKRILADAEKLAADRERIVSERSRQLSQATSRLAEAFNQARAHEQTVRAVNRQLHKQEAISVERIKVLEVSAAVAKGLNEELETIVMDLRARLEVAEAYLPGRWKPNFDSATVTSEEDGDVTRRIHLWADGNLEYTLEIPKDWDERFSGDAVGRWLDANRFKVPPFAWSTIYRDKGTPGEEVPPATRIVTVGEMLEVVKDESHLV